MNKYLIYAFALITAFSNTQVHAMVTQPQSLQIIPHDRIQKKPFTKAIKKNLAPLFAHPSFPAIKQQLLNKGIDLTNHISGQLVPINHRDMHTYLTKFSTQTDADKTIAAIELTHKKIRSLVELLNQAAPDTAFFFDYDDVLNVPDAMSKNHKILFRAIEQARNRGVRIYILSSGSKFCKNLKEEDFQKGFSRNPFLESTLTTPIHIPETYQDGQIAEFAQKSVKIQKTKAGNILTSKGNREYSDAAADIDVACMTYLDDPTQLSFVPANGKKPILIFSRGAITTSSILEYKGRRGSTITDTELFELAPAAQELDETKREALKAVLCDAPIKGNSFPLILDFLFKTKNLTGVKKIIFVDDSEHKILGAKAGFTHMQEKGLMRSMSITHALAVRFEPAKTKYVSKHKK